MKHLRAFAKSAVAGVPRALLARWGSVFVSLSVPTLFISLAASQAFLAAAGLGYAVYLLRDRRRIDFPPIGLPLALFCIGTEVSIAWSANPTAGWSVVRKVVLFVILLPAANRVSSGKHLEFLSERLFLAAAVAGPVAMIQLAVQYRVARARRRASLCSNDFGARCGPRRPLDEPRQPADDRRHWAAGTLVDGVA